MEEELNNKS